MIGSSLLALGFSTIHASPTPLPLDDGTWLRKSISVLPVAVAPCQKTPEKELKAEWKRDHPRKKGPSREELAALARRNADLCDEVRRNLESRGDAFSAVPRLKRFDRNPLDMGSEDHLRKELEHEGFGGKFEKALHRELGAPLVAILERDALDRARSLESDFQKNSMVAEKTKTEDITANQTAMIRGAAYLFAMRIDGLRVARAKDGWNVHARRHLEIWHFDPAKRSFSARARWDEETGGRSFADADALASDVWTGTSFDERILSMDEFRFTAQLDEVVEKGMRPAADIHATTDADLRVHRRFVYLENRLVPGTGTVRKEAGWGYVDLASPADSLYRIRHIGGQDPYAGLVVEEVPGTTWQILSFDLESTPSIGFQSYAPGLSIVFRNADPTAWQLRFGTRGNLPGDPANQSLLADFLLEYLPLHGVLRRTDLGYPAEQSATWMAGMGAEVGWTLRYPIRRLFFTAGPVAGARWEILPLHPAQWSATPLLADHPATAPSFARLDRDQEWLGLRAGAQWSLSVHNGIGLELGWEALRHTSSWSTGGSGESQTVEGGQNAGPGPVRFSLQWVFG